MNYRSGTPCQQVPRSPSLRPSKSCPNSDGYRPASIVPPSRLVYNSPQPWLVPPCSSARPSMPPYNAVMNRLPMFSGGPCWPNSGMNYNANSNDCWQFQQSYNNFPSMHPMAGNGNTSGPMNNYPRFLTPTQSSAISSQGYKPSSPFTKSYGNKWRPIKKQKLPLTSETKKVEVPMKEDRSLNNEDKRTKDNNVLEGHKRKGEQRRTKDSSHKESSRNAGSTQRRVDRPRHFGVEHQESNSKRSNTSKEHLMISENDDNRYSASKEECLIFSVSNDDNKFMNKEETAMISVSDDNKKCNADKEECVMINVGEDNKKSSSLKEECTMINLNVDKRLKDYSLKENNKKCGEQRRIKESNYKENSRSGNLMQKKRDRNKTCTEYKKTDKIEDVQENKDRSKEKERNKNFGTECQKIDKNEDIQEKRERSKEKEKSKISGTEYQKDKNEDINKERSKEIERNKTSNSEHQKAEKNEGFQENIDRSKEKERNSRERYRSRSRNKIRHRSRSKDMHSERYKEHSRDRSNSRRREHSHHRSSHRHKNRSKDRTNKSSRKESHSRHRSPRSHADSVSSFENVENRSDEENYNRPMNGDTFKLERNVWIRSSPAELYYQKNENDFRLSTGTAKLKVLHERFKNELMERGAKAKANKEVYEPPPRKICLKMPKTAKLDESESTSDEETESEEEDTSLEELERKKKHPHRLHEEMWYNDPEEMNDGPVCRCSAKARRSGIRHGIYPGEEHLPHCDPNSNNGDRLHHYCITMSPHTNFLTKCPTTIKHDGHEYIFEGFSMFSHTSLKKLPTCKVIRFNIEYTILYLEEKFPDNFTIDDLELFTEYLFQEVLELVDLDWKAHDDPDGCPRVHFMPRFARSLEDNGKELLSMNVVLQYLLNSSCPLVREDKLPQLMQLTQSKWQDFADEVRGMIVTYPGMKPCSLRVDQLDREQCEPEKGIFPEIVHFGIRPPQLSYAGNPRYQKAWRDYVKFRHLLANKPKVVYVDRHKLLQKEIKLQEMRMKSNLKRDVTVVISSKTFYRTGIMCDIVQHAMLLPVLVCHIRFHHSLDILEKKLGTCFKDRYLLQLALTHPSYRENFGTNPDHARNSLTNCGIRQPEYGDRRIHYMNTRKRGINTLINIMSRFGRRVETTSNINHNERLEFLGDAVVEFLSSIHLFFMFPDLEEGGLATYRAALVQNQHLAVLAKKLELERFMLYAHGSDLCHDLELRHAMANCFEALMGALFLDSGIDVADLVFCETLFSDSDLIDMWKNLPLHPLQEQEPDGDRKWIKVVPLLTKLHEFEKATGIEFTHVRLLARAFTHRSVGYNNLTLGSNQRLEFLGDTVLQLVASEYLYRYFPEHHEGHLSLLRSSLVNNRTQAVVCDDLGMVEYAIYPYPKGDLKTKDRADLLEAFLGALYVDKDLEYCQMFCQVCFFPRLQHFIMNQDWNDPKSKLQQCCLTLRTMDGGEPDIPIYKVIECKGPTNTRVYRVAVYFRGERLATGSGHSIQQAEMAAASNALDSSKANLFPQLNHQKRVIERSMRQQDHHKKRSKDKDGKRSKEKNGKRDKLCT